MNKAKIAKYRKMIAESTMNWQNLQTSVKELNSASIKFDVIAINQTRVVKGKTPVSSLN